MGVYFWRIGMLIAHWNIYTENSSNDVESTQFGVEDTLEQIEFIKIHH